MSFFDPQNPGLGGLDELTSAEEVFLTSFAGAGLGTINYIPKVTSSSTLGNSSITDDGTTVTFTEKLVLPNVASSLTMPEMTSGSILFAGTSGVVSQDNANLFWDNTNNRLALGTVSPSYKLDVYGTTATEAINTNIGVNFTSVTTPNNGSLALIAGAGNVDTGLHYYRVTYTTALGESNSFQIGSITTDTTTNGQVTVTIPVSSDPRVTGRKLYRTKAGTNSWEDFVLATIANNTATTYVDNIADASLTGTTGSSFYRTNTTNNFITLNGTLVTKIDLNGTYFGFRAGDSVTTGGYNSLFGADAGTAITTGKQNNFFGSGAGASTTTGVDNVAMGWRALSSNTTGIQNIALGRDAMISLQTASGNTAIGAFSMKGVAGNSNFYNSALGYQTLYGITSGSYNFAAGYQAGFGNTSGGNNIFIGRQAGDNHTTGSSNIFIGDRIDSQNITGNNQLNIGNLIFGTGLDGIGTTISTGRIGIGTTSPTATIHLKAGTATASTAPLKFTSGTLLTVPEAGAIEFLTDDFYGTITTGAARKKFVLDDGTALTSGRVPFATTNGRMTDDADMTFSGDTLTVTKLSAPTSVTSPLVISTDRVRLKGYTVATLPAGTQGDTAYVTDATAPTFLGALVGGGAVVTPVFYNGTAWVSS